MLPAVLPWLLYAQDANLSSRIALQDEKGQTINWRQLATKINRLAKNLHEQGISQQSAIALYGKNSAELVLLYLASIQLGAKVLGINPAYSVEQMQQLCISNQVDFYFSTEQQNIPKLTAIKLNTINFNELEENYCFDINLAFALQSLERPATMTLTSGSTGKPKAVVHNVMAHMANAKGVCQLTKFSQNDAWLLSLPLYHVSGQAIIWRWLTVGAELHLPQQDFYQSVLNASHASLVPTQLQRLLEYLTSAQLKDYRLKHLLLGGSHISPELTAALNRFAINSYSGYGMTEMASTVFAKKSDTSSGVGQPLAGREFCLVNGEIWLKGAGLALGYWQDGKIHSLLNEQGWLATNDKGQWRDNELFIEGRLDNMFISGGENIQPEQIETLIMQHQDVEQVFILPKEDQHFGHRPVAVICFKQGFSRQAIENLQNWLQPRLERFKQPIDYLPLDLELQKGNIKISRTQLIDLINKEIGG